MTKERMTKERMTKEKMHSPVKIHYNSRLQHPRYDVMRYAVLNSETAWDTDFANYLEKRPYYMHKNIENNLLLEKTNLKRYAESDTDKEELVAYDLKRRITYINGFKETLEEANIEFDDNNLPKNPMGRTGMWGPGLLGKNGPNQAADPIFTRWTQITIFPLLKAIYIVLKNIFIIDEDNNMPTYVIDIFKSTKYLVPQLEMIAIQRRDTKDWAIPGGMVEAGETVTQTLRHEINEEVCNNMDPDNASVAIDNIFSKKNEEIIYRGYVDDPRNTDTRWLETTAVHFHCSHKLAAAIKLEAGDDAQNVKWLRMSDAEPAYKNLYASHKMMTDKAKKNIMKNVHYNLFCSSCVVCYALIVVLIINN